MCLLNSSQVINSPLPPPSNVDSTSIEVCSLVDEPQQNSPTLVQDDSSVSSPMTSSPDGTSVKSTTLEVDRNMHYVEKSILSTQKSLSVEEIRFVQCTSPVEEEEVLPLTTTTTQRSICLDEDIDTNTTGSDIEVISCSTSTNGGEVHGAIPSNISMIMRQPVNAASSGSTDSSSLHPFLSPKHSIRGFSAPVGLSK
ncbi:unnamed protein product [Trichobilharzia regenti]|nr:unnamed protein product [Trichobilharzia regenti]